MEKNFFTIPYIKTFSEKFKNIAKKLSSSLAFSVSHPLKKYIKTGKDTIEKFSQNNLVYKISCINCEAVYVGQTKRQLKTRLKEHRQDINKKNGQLSVVSNHRLELDHEFDWESAEVLDREASYNRRLISEMIHIRRQKSALNKQSETELLSEIYLPFFE